MLHWLIISMGWIEGVMWRLRWEVGDGGRMPRWWTQCKGGIEWKWEGWRTYDERSVGGNVVQGDNEEFELGSGFGNEEWANYAVR